MLLQVMKLTRTHWLVPFSSADLYKPLDEQSLDDSDPYRLKKISK